MRAPFANSNPGVIDAQSLGAKAEMAQFFWDRILIASAAKKATINPG